jgi:hypothetical protein
MLLKRIAVDADCSDACKGETSVVQMPCSALTVR